MVYFGSDQLPHNDSLGIGACFFDTQPCAQAICGPQGSPVVFNATYNNYGCILDTPLAHASYGQAANSSCRNQTMGCMEGATTNGTGRQSGSERMMGTTTGGLKQVLVALVLVGMVGTASIA
ncbi:hypothetical protein IAR55_006386 [Kwoniella newhampshirensis]|uniref:Uncharacterized protein n=1 Tax=Kwoniella newhampshirensis TaxID=1651941 RepID=A0AAW0YU38_9TREE